VQLVGPAEYRSAGPLGLPCRHRLRPCRWRWRVWPPRSNAGPPHAKGCAFNGPA
jgi:hypothetical protein